MGRPKGKDSSRCQCHLDWSNPWFVEREREERAPRAPRAVTWSMWNDGSNIKTFELGAPEAKRDIQNSRGMIRARKEQTKTHTHGHGDEKETGRARRNCTKSPCGVKMRAGMGKVRASIRQTHPPPAPRE